MIRLAMMFAALMALFYFAGYSYLKYVAVDSRGLTIAQTLTVAGVRREMAHIADVEQEYFVVNGDCLSMRDLVSADKLEESDLQHSGFTFSIECDDAQFSVVGRHDPPSGDSDHSPRYPVLTMDRTINRTVSKPGQ